MDPPRQADHSVMIVVVVLTAIIFVLDLLISLGVSIWGLYVLPLGVSSWSRRRNFVFVVAAACTTFIVLGYFLSPPGLSIEFAIFNRLLGILTVWITAYFLSADRTMEPL
jgi:hypothetical protein